MRRRNIYYNNINLKINNNYTTLILFTTTHINRKKCLSMSIANPNSGFLIKHTLFQYLVKILSIKLPLIFAL